ncbi:MAG: glycosyltransferase family 2 protein [Lachnospiraceae bacterium]|nr:glycosyltransferase family 2 protein [Lachnospiraceae bacterium]
MVQTTVTVMLTCFNRIKYTVPCVKSLVEGNPNISFRFIITDDNSSDGTKEALEKLPYAITILSGDGQLFWNGGMSKALDYALHSTEKTEYYMLVNDDVAFTAGAIEKLIERQRDCSKEISSVVIVGATADSSGKTSYGGVKLLSKHFAKFGLIEPSKEYQECDTFNGNCVLLPKDVFFKAGNVDSVYRHSMSDYDYGMHIRKLGFKIYNSEEHVGTCNDNDISGSWRDTSLSGKERLKKKESPKGLPKKDWYHFIRKNYGFLPAVYHSVTPYLRILLGK